MADIFDKIEQTIADNCEHPKLVFIDRIQGNEIWPEDYTSNDKLFFEGLNVMRCTRCQKIIFKERVQDYLVNVKGSVKVLYQGLPKGERLLIKGQGEEIFGKMAGKEEESPLKIRNPENTMKDVILSVTTRNQLDAAFAKVKYRDLIYKQWGFEAVDRSGSGAIFLFYGLPGTGKTSAAEAIASELKVPFIDVSLAQLESKFMGETAKNIEKAFELANEQGALLFFDEADNVLGTRLSSVTQGVDAEINLSRSVMLKELERFSGYCIFATNFQRNIDNAFRRRIYYHIEFALPDAEARYKIWDRFLVQSIPLSEDRHSLLEKSTYVTDGFSGGEILQAMRIALGIAVAREGEKKLLPDDLAQAIEQTWHAKEHIGRGKPSETAKKIRELFNLSNKE